jgi:glycine/D-amino acid oxidase-like deaminating enzyme
LEVSLTTEEAKTMLTNDATNVLPTLSEAKLVEHRGDFECWSPAPNHIRPVLGRLPEWDNVYIAARFGTLGMSMSLGAGEVMADLISAGGRAPDRVRTMLDVLNPPATL